MWQFAGKAFGKFLHLMFIDIFFKGVLIGAVVSVFLVPTLLWLSQAFLWFNSGDSDYKIYLSEKAKIEALMPTPPSSQKKEQILKSLELIKTLASKGVYGTSYAVSIYYAYGIPDALEPSKVICGQYKMKAAQNWNPSALFVDC